MTQSELIALLTGQEKAAAEALLNQNAALGDELRQAEGRMRQLTEPDQAWAGLALALFNLKEFVYLR